MNDCRAVVVRDTPEKFDGVEKRFAFKKEKGLTPGARRKTGRLRRRGTQEEPKSTVRSDCATSGMRIFVRQL
jgi:hypothetical protein